jgi:hypothetical protein
MADIDRVELLMRLSENMRTDNEEWRKQIYREGQERAKRVLEMIQRFEYEYAALDRERQSLSQYLPRQQQQEKLPPAEPLPRVATQGPKQ